jgi:hypothetical protein
MVTNNQRVPAINMASLWSDLISGFRSATGVFRAAAQDAQDLLGSWWKLLWKPSPAKPSFRGWENLRISPFYHTGAIGKFCVSCCDTAGFCTKRVRLVRLDTAKQFAWWSAAVLMLWNVMNAELWHNVADVLLEILRHLLTTLFYPKSR